MQDNIILIRKKIIEFWRKSAILIGKEISLESNQNFSINQKITDDTDKGIYTYNIQYGFPQSGCVCLTFVHDTKAAKADITAITVYAPAADKELNVVNFAPQFESEDTTVSFRTGLDMQTKPHTSSEDIETNPNALKMLELATSDLENAKILGDCRLAVPIGSDEIPVTNSSLSSISKTK